MKNINEINEYYKSKNKDILSIPKQKVFPYLRKIDEYPTKNIKIIIFIEKKNKITEVLVEEKHLKGNIINFTSFMENKDKIIGTYIEREVYELRDKNKTYKENTFFIFKNGFTLKNIEYQRKG